MTVYALVLNGVIVQTDPATFPVNAALSWTPDISAVSPEPQVGWGATEAGGVWTFTAPTVAPIDTRAAAQAALDKSDVTMIRVAEAVSLGLTTWTTADVVAWADYRRTLRAHVSGGPTTAALPVAPAYPAGT